MTPRFWIGVASRDHVKTAEAGGFVQLGHGAAAPVRRLSPGDGLVRYAPRDRGGEGAPVRAFVAIGRIGPGEPHVSEQSPGFRPTRRAMSYAPCVAAPIRPLLDGLDFITDTARWGMPFRRASFEISGSDFATIAAAMNANDVI